MDDTATTPVIKSTTISASRMMGREVGGASGSVGKESKIGTLSRILRTTRIKVNAVEGQAKINAEKIKRIKNIIKEQKSDLAEKLSSLDETAEFASVEKGLDEIIKTLQKERKAEEKAAEAARRKKERDRAKSREKKLESGLGKGIKKVVGTVVKPFKSIFDKIFGFLLNVLIGRTIIKLIGWFSDKENQRKVKSLIRFVKDWWPALTAAALIFGTSFGTMAGGLVSLIGGFIPKLLSLSVRLAAAIARNPYAAAVLVTAGSAVALASRAKDSTEQIIEDKGLTDATPKEQADELSKPPAIAETFTRTILPSLNQRQGFSGGGLARSNARGTDTVPAMLTPGEFVMSRGAVNKFGADTLASMNAMGGGTNKPKVTSGITYASGGGGIGPSFAEHSSDLRFGLSGESFINAGVNVQKQLESRLSDLVTEGLRLVPRLETQLVRAGRFVETNSAALVRQSEKFAAGLMDAGQQVTSDVLNYYQSGELERQMASGLESAQTAGPGLLNMGRALATNKVATTFDNLIDITSSDAYKGLSKKNAAVDEKEIAIADSIVNSLPEGSPLQNIMDKGLIPIPSGDASTMRNLTFVKALLGPLGKPFKIMSNAEVDRMRQMTIDKTLEKSGLIMGKDGEVKMNWNQEDINKGARGGGAYTDDLGPGGKAFNSILGRFTASTRDGGNILYTDDRYNFNKSTAEYLGLAKDQLLGGAFGEAAYFAAASMGKFAEDMGWLNQRALGSRIEIGQIDRNAMPESQSVLAARKNEAKKMSGLAPTQADMDWYNRTMLQQKQIKLSKSQRQLNPVIGPPVRPQPRVEFMDIVDKFNQLGGDPPEPAGRNNIPPFSPITAGSRPKTDLLGLLTNF
jgi:hypothetical protein